MKNSIKTSALILLTIAVASLLLASCQKKGISKWECVPMENVTINLTYDENAEMAFVKVVMDTLSGYVPSVQNLFFTVEDTLIRIGDNFYHYRPSVEAMDTSCGFFIVQNDKNVLELRQFGHGWQDDSISPVVLIYKFYRKD